LELYNLYATLQVEDKNVIKSIDKVSASIKDLKIALEVMVSSMSTVPTGLEKTISSMDKFNTVVEAAGNVGKITSGTGKMAKEFMKVKDTIDGAALVLGKKITVESLHSSVAAAGMKINAAGNFVTEAGTIATNKEVAALLASTGAVSAKGVVVGVLTKQIGIVTVAQLLWSKAMNNMLPIFGLVAVVAGLVAVVGMLIKKHNEESESSKELREETEALTESTNSLTESLQSSAAGFAGNNKSIEYSAKASENLANKVEELSKKENKNAEDKAKLHTYVNMLNDSMGDLGLEYDAENDSLNMSTNLINEKVNAYKEQAKAQAAQERYIELLKEEMEVQEQLDNITAQRDKWAEQLKDVGKETKEYKEGIAALVIQEEELNATKTALGSTIKNVENQMIDSAAMQAEAAQKQADEVEAAHVQQMEAAAKMAEQQAAITEEMKKDYETIADAASDMHSKINAEVEVTAEQMLENQRHNMEKTEEWADNIAYLNGKINADYLAELKKMGPASAAEVAAWAAASEDELIALNENFAKSAEISGAAFVKTLGEAEIPEEVSALMEAAKLACEEGIEEAHLPKVAERVGGDLAEGIGNSQEVVENAVTDIVNTVNETATELMGSDGSSKVFSECGATIVEELVNGIDENIHTVVEKLKVIMQSMIPVFQESGTSLGEQITSGVSTSMASLTEIIRGVVSSTVPIFQVWMVLANIPITVGMKQMTNTLLAAFADANNITRNAMQTFKITLETSSQMAFSSVNTNTATGMQGFGKIVENESSSIADRLKATLDKVVVEVGSWTQKLTEAGRQGVTSLKDTILSIANEISLHTTGQNVVEGMWQGMQSKRDYFYNNVYNFFKEMVKQAKNALDIHSPSRVFKELGNFTVEGFILGLDNMKEELDTIMDTLFIPDLEDLSVGFNTEEVSSNNRNGNTEGDVYITQNIQAVPQTPYELAIQTKAAFRRARWA